MKTFTSIPKQVQQVLENCGVTTSRRNFLKSGGLLVVSFSAAQAQAAGPYPDPDLGPKIDGGRPRDYREPLPEPVRNRIYWDSSLWRR